MTKNSNQVNLAYKQRYNKIRFYEIHKIIVMVSFLPLLFLLFNLLFMSCGIPLPYLSLNKITIQINGLPYYFTFSCQNTETYFKGYNFFYKVEDDISESSCTLIYGNPEIYKDAINPLLQINNNTEFFQIQQTIKVYIDPDHAPSNLSIDITTSNPLEVILKDKYGNNFTNNPSYYGKKVTFIIRPYGEDINGNPIPFDDSTSNEIDYTF